MRNPANVSGRMFRSLGSIIDQLNKQFRCRSPNTASESHRNLFISEWSALFPHRSQLPTRNLFNKPFGEIQNCVLFFLIQVRNQPPDSAGCFVLIEFKHHRILPQICYNSSIKLTGNEAIEQKTDNWRSSRRSWDRYLWTLGCPEHEMVKTWFHPFIQNRSTTYWVNSSRFCLS